MQGLIHNRPDTVDDDDREVHFVHRFGGFGNGETHQACQPPPGLTMTETTQTLRMGRQPSRHAISDVPAH